MFEILKIEVTPFQQNARILYCSESKEGVLIDPGGDAKALLQTAADSSLRIEQVWLTHSHLDHSGGVRALLQECSAKLYAHRAGEELRAHVVDFALMYGLGNAGMENCPEPDIYIDDGQMLSLGDNSFQVLFTPGHSPDSVCFYSAAAGVLIAGDTLFAGSIGRTDLPGGNHETILNSIKEKILILPEETKVLSGHGPESTVGMEKRSNPFLMGV